MDKTPNGGGGGGGKEPERVVVNGYVLTRTLGQGTYGKVRLGEHVEDGSRVAVKVIEKAQIHSDKHVSRIQREIRFLKLLFHPNIVRVYDVEETPSEIYILMELASGGELFDYIVAHKRVREKEARAFFRMMLSA
ncbi:MAG: kinase-like domain-containing protein, partial [Olpidium bornovanus]